MDINEAKKRIEKLREQITDFRYRYHVENDPKVTDDVYESLSRELKDLEKQFPEFYDSNSPVNRVAGKPLNKFHKVNHEIPMLSLNDVFNKEELEAWETRIQRLLSEKDQTVQYFCEIKYDGLAVSLTYEKGKFVRGSTRGDGKIGEDITQNLKMVENIPLSLKEVDGFLPDYIEVRGEAVMSKAILIRLNEKNKKEGKVLFANTRNAAAGSLRQLDSNLARERHLDFFAFDIAEIRGAAQNEVTQDKISLSGGSHSEGEGRSANKFYLAKPKSHSEKHALLRKLGFEMSDNERVCKNLGEVLKFIDNTSKIRDKYPYNTDGVVISVDSLDIQDTLGVVGKAPRYMAAFKYPAERATTIIKDILINVGRTGVLTPLAVFQPTLVAGSTIGKATLHNMDQIERLDVRVGDTVVIQKAGDVIPEVVEVLLKMRTGKEKKFKMPAHCPVCGGKVENRGIGTGEVLSRKALHGSTGTSRAILQQENMRAFRDNTSSKSSVAYYCINPNCPAKNRRGMQHFVNAFEVYEVGPKVLDRFKDEGLISDAADLFTLKKEDIALLERFGEKSAENIIQSIEDHKKVPLWRFLYALGILHIGEQTAQDIAENFGTLEKIMGAKMEDLADIENIGQVVAKSLYEFFHQKENINFINKLLKNGVLVLKGEKKKQGKLSGLSFVITGTLESMSRNIAKEKILSLGGKVASAVSYETDYLLAGAEAGSKLTKAQKLGTKILTEDQFLKIL